MLSSALVSRGAYDFIPGALIDLPAPISTVLSPPRTISDHHLRCGNLWWLATHGRKPTTRAFIIHCLPFGLCPGHCLLNFQLLIPGPASDFAGGSPDSLRTSRLFALAPALPPSLGVLPSCCPPLQPSRREAISLAALSATFCGSASVFTAESFFALLLADDSAPAGCWNSVGLLQGAAFGRGLPSGLAEAVSELLFDLTLCLPASSFPVPLPRCHIGTECDSCPCPSCSLPLYPTCISPQ